MPAFGRWSIASIQREDVETFVARVTASGLSPARVRNIYRVLSGVMRSAQVNRRIVASPCTDISLPRMKRVPIRPLDAEQVGRLAAAAGDDAPLIYFAAYTGLRFGECAALRVGRINFLRPCVDVVESMSEVHGQLYFDAPKNGRSRTVTLPRFVAEMLARV